MRQRTYRGTTQVSETAFPEKDLPGNTFLIRAYGKSLLPDGSVAANAWCEAVFQRQPEYMDSHDAADRKMRLDVGTPAPQKHNDLQSLNQNSGRQFKMVSFRWLNSNEI